MACTIVCASPSVLCVLVLFLYTGCGPRVASAARTDESILDTLELSEKGIFVTTHAFISPHGVFEARGHMPKWVDQQKKFGTASEVQSWMKQPELKDYSVTSLAWAGPAWADGNTYSAVATSGTGLKNCKWHTGLTTKQFLDGLKLDKADERVLIVCGGSDGLVAITCEGTGLGKQQSSKVSVGEVYDAPGAGDITAVASIGGSEAIVVHSKPSGFDNGGVMYSSHALFGNKATTESIENEGGKEVTSIWGTSDENGGSLYYLGHKVTDSKLFPTDGAMLPIEVTQLPVTTTTVTTTMTKGGACVAVVHSLVMWLVVLWTL